MSRRYRCMGRGCDRAAELVVKGLVPTLAVTQSPVVLCRRCLLRGGEAVDFLKWMDAIEAVEAAQECRDA